MVIETPKGSHNKYDYDPECDCFGLATVLPEGMTFAYDFEFMPSTLGEDGDPLEVLVLMDFSVIPGCLLKVREWRDPGQAKEKRERLDPQRPAHCGRTTRENAHRCP